MKESKVLQIITSNIMEGTGFKSLFEQKKPEYKILLHLISKTSLLQNSLYDEIKTSFQENNIIIIDTDSFENDYIFDFLTDLTERGAKCIIYSKLSTAGLIIKARELLISGYVSKSSSLDCLLNCLDVVELGGTYYDTCFSDLIKQILIFEKELSLTEKRIFYEVLLFPNSTMKDLAEILNSSKHTVEVHLSNLYKKANVNSYNELISRFSL